MADIDVVLADKHRATHRISTFTFARADGEPLPAWEPGAHISLALSHGRRRDYSLCGDSGVGTWTVAVQREPTGRGGSMELHDHLAVGQTLSVSEPLNSFRLAPAEAYLFIAGGIGITPLLPMIEQLEREGHPHWRLIYLVHDRRDAIFLDRITDHARIQLWVAGEAGERYDLASLTEYADGKTEVYACGPMSMLTQLEELWAERDADEHLHREYFVGVDDVLEDASGSFEVELAKSGKVVSVPAHRSILSVVEEAVPGISIYQSCREGICGSCETAVLAGEPEHRDLVLTKRQKEKGDRMMICVSRAATARLTLDL